VSPNADTPTETVNELLNVDRQRNGRLGAMYSFAKNILKNK